MGIYDGHILLIGPLPKEHKISKGEGNPRQKASKGGAWGCVTP